MSRAHTTARVLMIAAVALPVAGALSGCRGDRSDKPPRLFFPDMDHQPKWTEQAETPFFADGRVQRPEVAGTVAFGRTSHSDGALGAEWAGFLAAERDRMLADDPGLYRGVRVNDDGSESYLDVMPVPVTMEMIQRGQERFNIYCSACHGYLGDGAGTVGQRWSYSPANLLGEQYQDRAQRQGKDGYLFHVVRNGVVNATGVQVMPGYRERVNEADAWAIVAYLRSLQQSQNAPLEDVPPEYRPAAAAPAPSPNSDALAGGLTDDRASEGGE